MEAFLQFLKTSKKPETVLSYRRDLKALLHAVSSVEEATEAELRSYFSDLSRTRSRTAFARAFSVARQYFAFEKKRGRIPLDPMEGIRSADYSPKKETILEADDFDRLLTSSFYGLRGRRDLAMLTLLCETGMKVSELVQLSRSDFSSAGSYLDCGQGKKRRRIPLSPVTSQLLSEVALFSEMQNPAEEALFLGSTGKRMTRQGFWKNLKDRSIRCGVADCTPEALRYSLARHLIRDGRERREVLHLLGNLGKGCLRKYEN